MIFDMVMGLLSFLIIFVQYYFKCKNNLFKIKKIIITILLLLLLLLILYISIILCITYTFYIFVLNHLFIHSLFFYFF